MQPWVSEGGGREKNKDLSLLDFQIRRFAKNVLAEKCFQRNLTKVGPLWKNRFSAPFGQIPPTLTDAAGDW